MSIDIPPEILRANEVQSDLRGGFKANPGCTIAGLGFGGDLEINGGDPTEADDHYYDTRFTT